MKLYQILETDKKEEDNDETSVTSDDTPRMSNETEKVKSNEDTIKNHCIENTTMEMLNLIIQEFLADEQSELREINRLCSNISAKLTIQYQNDLEDQNWIIEKWLLQLKRINYDCHRYIGELYAEISGL